METDMYSTYDDCKFPLYYPTSFNRECSKKKYMRSYPPPTFIFDFGDTVELPFTIDEDFWDYDIFIEAYNFRFEKIAEQQTTVSIVGEDESTQQGLVYFSIPYTETNNYIRGIYYIRILAKSNPIITDSGLQYTKITTLASFPKYSFFVR